MANGAEPTRLNAASEDALAEALEDLAPGERGWITFQEAQHLFSPLDDGDITALSEFDEAGIRNLGTFAANHHCSQQRAGDQVFFTRNQ